VADDNRFVFYGMRYIVETYLHKQWTAQDVEKAGAFYSTHNAGNTAFPFPKELFMRIVNELDGYFPITVEALPEGTVAHVHTPVYQITAVEEWSPLVTFFETLLTHVWYTSTVATLSRMARDIFEEAFAKSVDDDASFLLESRLHDFGFRGCTCLEQSMLGGAAHLLNFTGSDTMSASYYVQYMLNGGRPVASSIPATEHSVMTAWHNEREAIKKMIDAYGSGVYACVLDSYDYMNALENVIPSLAKRKTSHGGGVMVMRPDSGDPVDNVLRALEAAEKVFGVTENSKHFKVIKGAAVIQGDGVDREAIHRVLEAVLKAGYSAQNVAFGMGGGLLQKINRDTMSFATKLSYVHYKSGEERDVMKFPKTDKGKKSLPGILRVVRQTPGKETVLPRDSKDRTSNEHDLLKIVYDCRPIEGVWDDFDVIRNRVREEWKVAPKDHDVISLELQEKIATVRERDQKNVTTHFVEDDFEEKKRRKNRRKRRKERR